MGISDLFVNDAAGVSRYTAPSVPSLTRWMTPTVEVAEPAYPVPRSPPEGTRYRLRNLMRRTCRLPSLPTSWKRNRLPPNPIQKKKKKGSARKKSISYSV